MYREIVFPSEEKPVYEFPKETYGRKVEIIIEDEVTGEDTPIRDLLKEFTFHSGGYTFDRAEANNYE